MREISQERLLKDAKRVLENPFWVPGLDPKTLYTRIHDDTDGTNIGAISVTFTDDSDAWIVYQPNHRGGSLRFRTEFGGGQSPRVRNALMLLAWAIKLDNEERPQQPVQEEG